MASRKIVNTTRSSQKGQKRPTYKKGRKSRAKTSYESYLEQRKKWESKGYLLDPAMGKQEFEQNYKLAKDAGDKNIAREFAEGDRQWTKAQAKEIQQLLPELSVDDIIGADFSGYNPNWERYLTSRESLYERFVEAYKKAHPSLLPSDDLIFDDVEGQSYFIDSTGTYGNKGRKVYHDSNNDEWYYYDKDGKKRFVDPDAEARARFEAIY